MSNYRIRILLSLVFSFILVQGYIYFSQNPQIIPAQAENIKGALSGIKFPQVGQLFTLNFSSMNSQVSPSKQWGENSFNLPSISNAPSNNQSNTIQPTIPQDNTNNYIIPTDIINEIPQISQPVTATSPKPTKPPKPTATPPLPPITSDTRPGSTMAEIFQEVSKRECVPAALLYAIQAKETGPYFSFNSSASIIKIYNTYGWWNTGTGDPCFGMGYHTQTGIIPQDSVNAGQRCRKAIGDQSYDQGIMGILQISQQEQDAVKKYVAPILPKSYDRRVLFDNALIFAIITKNRLSNPPSNCDDWPDSVILDAAEKHLGTCKYDYGNGSAGNYCTDVLKFYKQYK